MPGAAANSGLSAREPAAGVVQYKAITGIMPPPASDTVAGSRTAQALILGGGPDRGRRGPAPAARTARGPGGARAGAAGSPGPDS